MRNYEVMFIVKPTLEDEATNAVCESMKKVLEDAGATIKDVKNMGRRELAYEVRGFNNGTYFLITVESKPAAVKEFDRKVLINENVLRHLIIKKEGE